MNNFVQGPRKTAPIEHLDILLDIDRSRVRVINKGLEESAVLCARYRLGLKFVEIATNATAFSNREIVSDERFQEIDDIDGRDAVFF